MFLATLPLSRLLNRCIYKPCCGTAVCGEVVVHNTRRWARATVEPSVRVHSAEHQNLLGWTLCGNSRQDCCPCTIARTHALLGHSCTAGEAVPKDLMESMPRFILVADLGSARACNNIGLHHNDGVNVSRDIEKAAFFYRGGAFRGCVSARDDIGTCECEA